MPEDTQQKVSIILQAKDQASSTIKQVADTARRELSGGAFKGLKDAFGEDSSFGALAKMFKGAGALGGLSLASQTLNTLTKGAVEFRNAMQDSSKSVGDIVEQTAGAIPVYGQIWQAGRNIHELFAGDQAYLQQMTEDAERMNGLLSFRRNLLKEENEQHRQMLETMQSIKDRMALMNNPLQPGNTILGLTQSNEQQRREVADQLKKSIDAANEAFAKDPGVQATKEKLKAAMASYQTELDIDLQNNGYKDAPPQVKAGAEYSTRKAKELVASLAMQLAGAQKQHDAHIAQLRSDAEKLTGIRKEETDALIEQAKQEASIRDSHLAAIRSDYQERLKLARDFTAQLGDIQQSARESQLRGAGRGFDADMLRSRFDLAKAHTANMLGMPSTMGLDGTFNFRGLSAFGSGFNSLLDSAMTEGALQQMNAARIDALKGELGKRGWTALGVNGMSMRGLLPDWLQGLNNPNALPYSASGGGIPSASDAGRLSGIVAKSLEEQSLRNASKPQKVESPSLEKKIDEAVNRAATSIGKAIGGLFSGPVFSGQRG